MRKQLLDVLKYTFGLGLAAVLIYFAYKDQDWATTWATLKGSNFWWLLPAAFFGFLAHYIRGARWAMLIKAAGYQTSAQNAFWATGVGYAANNVVPRLGELTRCTMLVQSDRVPFFASAGTVVTERIIDVLTLGLLLLLVAAFELDGLLAYFEQATGNGSASQSNIGLYLGIVAVLGGVGLVAVYLFRKPLLATAIGQKVWGIIQTVVGAMLSIRKLKRAWLFVVYTIAIWLCYILFAWIWLQGFSEDHHFTFYTGFLIVSMGAIGMAVPTPGGIGPYHNVAKFTFVMIGLSPATGATLAIFLHTPQYLTGFLVGIVGYLVLLFQKRRLDKRGVQLEVDAEGQPSAPAPDDTSDAAATQR